MSRSYKKHCFVSPRRSHSQDKHKVLKAKKHKVRSLLATRYDDADLLLPGKEQAGWNSKAWYESYSTWYERRNPSALGLLKRLWPTDYFLYYLKVLRK